MKFKLLIVLSLFVLMTGCSTVTPVNTTIPVTVNLTSNDLKIGKVVTHSIPYDKKDPHIIAKVYRAALEESGYDFILLPQIDITSSLFKSTITIKGYGAKLNR